MIHFTGSPSEMTKVHEGSIFSPEVMYHGSPRGDLKGYGATSTMRKLMFWVVVDDKSKFTCSKSLSEVCITGSPEATFKVAGLHLPRESVMLWVECVDDKSNLLRCGSIISCVCSSECEWWLTSPYYYV